MLHTTIFPSNWDVIELELSEKGYLLKSLISKEAHFIHTTGFAVDKKMFYFNQIIPNRFARKIRRVRCIISFCFMQYP